MDQKFGLQQKYYSCLSVYLDISGRSYTQSKEKQAKERGQKKVIEMSYRLII
jgi:hypothetical protein